MKQLLFQSISTSRWTQTNFKDNPELQKLQLNDQSWSPWSRRERLLTQSFDIFILGSSAYTCWAFSAASMIRNSCRVMIENLKKNGIIDEDIYDFCMKMINDSLFHVETRNAILMILVPRHLHVDDESQTAFLRAAVSRVRYYQLNWIMKQIIFYDQSLRMRR